MTSRSKSAINIDFNIAIKMQNKPKVQSRGAFGDQEQNSFEKENKPDNGMDYNVDIKFINLKKIP